MAGFTKQNFPRLEDTILVAEPEAAALYTLRTQLEIEGDEFMVVCRDIRILIRHVANESAGRLLCAL
jgi:hypothetical protein